jgi:putative membrane protein
MPQHYWNDWYVAWGWLLWLAFTVLLFSSAGNWGYTYHAHRKYDGGRRREALDAFNERLARGEITREQYLELKSKIPVVAT